MSHFYGMIPVSARRTVPTARGHSELKTIAAGWPGAITVALSTCPDTKRDRYSVRLIDWPSKNVRTVLAEGWLDEASPEVVAKVRRKGRKASAMG